MSSALWCVLKGRAMAPPGIGCIIGVSTSRKPRASRKARMAWMSRERSRKISPRLRVHDQVDVALPVARLDVLEPVPLLGQRAQRLGQERQRLHRHRQLAGARAHHLAGDADEVAQVQLGEEREVVAELVGPRVELDPPGLVHEVGEARLAVVAQGHDAAGQAHRPQRLQLLVGRRAQPRVQRAGPVRHRVAAAERIERRAGAAPRACRGAGGSSSLPSCVAHARVAPAPTAGRP